MSQYNSLRANVTKRSVADCDVGQCVGGSIAPPEPPKSPIESEIIELRLVTSNLERAIFQLADQLYPVRMLQSETKSVGVDAVSSEPSSGCSIKDQLAERKQHLLYLERTIHAVKDSLFV